ncbi:MAG: MFS transporter, partial [Alistipes sp.]|nr:MFS transporter [Alistipes sp.]
FKHVEGGNAKKADVKDETPVEELSPAETKSRIVALCLVFAVVIFFWMAFHQNGLTLTYFANEFTQKTSTGAMNMLFSVWNLVAIIAFVYGAFSIFQSKTTKGKAISTGIVLAALGFLAWQYFNTVGLTVPVDEKYFQSFNPFYVVALTPVSMAVFGYLASKGKEPSAPRKIAYGMLIAALGFMVMAYGSIGLLTPDAQKVAGEAATLVSPSWLINTYLVLTFAELFLSPMGISFVSKVAPPKFKGLMMGGWFAATAIGNYLTKVGASFWNDMPLVGVWSIFIVLCLLSALFMFVMMKRLEAATK